MNSSVSIRVEQIELEMPHRWLGTRLTGNVYKDPQVNVQGWQVEVLSPEQPSGGGMGSTAELLDDLVQVVLPLKQWVHTIALTNGDLNLGESHYAISMAALRDDVFTIEALESRAVVDLDSLPAASLSLSVSNKLAAAEIRLRREDADWRFEGGLNWRSNQIELNGEFDHQHWLPAEATLDSPSIHLPSSWHGLKEIPDLRGSAQAGWTNGTYTFDVTLTNQPVVGAPVRFDPVSFQLTGTGDLRALKVNRLEMSAPFLRATLDKPLTFEFAGSVEGWNATLSLWADLSQIENVAVEGQLSGDITVKPTIRSPLRAGFSVHGTNIAGAGLQTRLVEIKGLLHWPLLQVTNQMAEFESGGRLTTDFAIEFDQKRTASPPGTTGDGQPVKWHLQELHWSYDGPSPHALPESVKLETIHSTGTAMGVWPDLTHTGMVEVVGVEAGVFRATKGRVGWTGRRLKLDHVAAAIERAASIMETSGKGGVAFEDDGTRASLDFESFKLISQKGRWELSEPFQISVLNRTGGLKMDLSPLELTGPDTQVSMKASVDWPAKGAGAITLRGLSSSHIDNFLAPDLPELLVPEAALTFDWDNGPLVFDLNGEAQWREGSNTVWSLSGHAQSDGHSLKFGAIRLALNSAPCAEVTGHLPLGIDPSKGWRVVESETNSGAQFDVRMVEEGPVWSRIEKLAGVKIASPTVEFRVRGELPDVSGALRVGANQVRLANTNANPSFALPALEDVRLEADMDLSGIHLHRANAQLLGQKIEAQARYNIAATNWTDWWDALRAPDWQRLTGSMRTENAELSALSAMASGIVAPVGNLDLDLALEPGLRVNGQLRITSGATRFLKPLGALRDIDADISLDGLQASVNTFNATLGGRPVRLSGELAWRADGDRQFDLRLTGKNLSLVRDPDLFVRADLDLHLQKTYEEVAHLTGEVQLQRSLLFRDFNSLVGLDRDQPEQRPPYFSVRQSPFGDWNLDVRVKGDRFLKVFSPAFKGEVSAGLQLLGTLREPMAIGAVTVDSGKILFPFGTLEIENGRVDLTREDPYRPRLDFKGEGQNFGYTVTVDLRGPLDAPNLTFQSVPPLNAQQILLMLTAGEIPRSDFGYNTTDKASRVGFYVGKQFVNRFIGNTSTSERLTLRSGENVTNDGKLTYSIEYRLTDRWSAFGEYDRFQNVNSGLKFKVLSK